MGWVNSVFTEIKMQNGGGFSKENTGGKFKRQ
jgi:hypothetical protein